MASKEKTYILKHTAEGLRLLRDRDSDQGVKADEPDDLPTLDALVEPRWNHWYQRKLARPWQATLLGMNIEPISSARRILKIHDPDRYQTYRDRLDILQTLVGIEIGLYEDHVREGEGANEKYIELAEYCRYAENLEWPGIGVMRVGLKLDEKPPVLKTNAKQENNIVRVLDVVFRCVVPQYMNAKGNRSASAVNQWLKDNDETLEIGESTLRSWFDRMIELEVEKKV